MKKLVRKDIFAKGYFAEWMIFQGKDKLFRTYHSPNKSGYGHLCFVEMADVGNGIVIKK